MRRITIVTTLLVIVSSVILPNVGAQPAEAQISTTWTVEYFNNAALSGYPVSTASAAQVYLAQTFDSPVPGYLPPDYFSIRWSSLVYLDAGTYQATALADDGVRVWFNDLIIIDEFHDATGNIYTGIFTATAGQHRITVEYYEAAELAFLEFSLQPYHNPVGPTALVNATLYALSTPNGTPAIQVYQGQSYPLVGRSEDWMWWQLSIGGQYAWLHNSYLTLYNQGTVPVTAIVVPPATPTPLPTPTVAPPEATHVRALSTVELRSGPHIQYAIVAWLDYNEMALILERDPTGNWLRVQRNNNGTGWVAISQVTLWPGANLNRIPVVQGPPPAVTPLPPVATEDPASYAITPTSVDLSMRSGPGAQFDHVGWLRFGQFAQVIARDTSGAWLQIFHENQYGWVNANYVTIQSAASGMAAN